MKRIIDTNVLLTANGAADHREFNCMEACIDFLEIIKQQGIVVIDDGYFIMGEYDDKVNPNGSQLGGAFLKWLYRHEWTDRCEHVPITAIEIDAKKTFVEFPYGKHVEFDEFNVSDRMFVAVALTHPEHPPIVNATDSDWAEIEQILCDEYQVQVIQLCPKSTEEPAIKQSRGRKLRPIFDESSPIIEQKPRKRRPTLE